VGAARGAGIGAGIYKDAEEAFATLKKNQVITPEIENVEATKVAYEKWLSKTPNP
ncbi:MAG: carbohydrate kinase, partial [Paludibacter sp.]